MFEKLKEAERRFTGIEDSLASPDITSDTAKYTSLLKEYKSLSPVVEKYREYKKCESDAKEAEEMLRDPELHDMAEAELRESRTKLNTLTDELKLLLLPKDPNDERNVIVEIRACAGGEEAALFAAVLYRMYSMYAAKQNWKMSLLSENETELGGFREVTFMLEGENAFAHMKYESGVHRVQRVPETEAQGRIQTSTVSVAVLPEAEDVEIEINPADLKFETCKSSGAGGQHINKTESAVRITHIPTGIVVECQEERSQFKNRDKAMKMLRTKLYDIKQREMSDAIASTRREQVGSGDRSEKIRTYNYPQSRVTDHRIKMTLYSLENFLNGDIGGMIEALATHYAAEKLKSSET